MAVSSKWHVWCWNQWLQCLPLFGHPLDWNTRPPRDCFDEALDVHQSSLHGCPVSHHLSSPNGSKHVSTAASNVIASWTSQNNLTASRVDSASVSTACPSSESRGSTKPANHNDKPICQGHHRRFQVVPEVALTFLLPLWSAAVVPAMSAFWYFPMLRCSFLPGIVSSALGESEPRLDASCMRARFRHVTNGKVSFFVPSCTG